MALTGEQIADLVMTSQRDLGRMKFVDLRHDLTDFVVMPQLLKKERMNFEGGTGSEFRVQIKTSGSARHTQLYDVDNVNVVDTMKKGFVPYRHNTVDYSYDEREVKQNSGGEYRIVDLVQTRRIAALSDLCELFEIDFWSKPVDSTDELSPWGIPMFIVKNNNATPGFLGGNPSGFSDGYAGLSSTTYTRWKNWAGGYAEISKADLVRKMREATEKTGFKTPIKHPTPDGASRRVCYTNYTVKEALELLLEQQNDNLGNDLASKDGLLMFRRNPVEYVPYLDSDTSNPVYGIDWSTLRTIFLRGEYLNEMAPIRAPKQHRVWEVHVDCTFNFRCHNRRKNWVLSV